MALCGEDCIATRGRDIRRAVTMRCRSWTCEECQPRRKRNLVAQAAGGQPNMLLTFTTRQVAGGDTATEAKRQSKALAELKRRIIRVFKVERIEWLVVREAHKTGWPHLHVLARLRYIPQRWLSTQWLSITKSSRVYVQRIKSQKMAANYVSKYIGKAPARFGNAKRYWKTKLYDLRPKLKDENELQRDEYWQRQGITQHQWEHEALCEGYRLKATRNDLRIYTLMHLIL